MSVRTPEDLEAFILADPLARDLAALGREHGRPIALVGGWVRDWLLGRSPLDWDLVLPGDPTSLVAAYARKTRGPVVVLDAEMGVVRTRLKRGLVLDFVKRQGETLEVDLARRDLTINAMACDLETGQLIDPSGGLADLRAGRIRTRDRGNLEDDPLRMLRVYRFSAVLGYAVTAETASWVRELAPTIDRSAGERILAELGKLLASPRAPEALAAAEAVGLLGRIFPALDAEGAAGAIATSRAMVGVLAALAGSDAEPGARTLAVFDQAPAGDRPIRSLLLLAALLAPRPEAFAAMAERLKWSNKEGAWVEALAAGPEAAFAAAAAPAAEGDRAMYRLWRAHGEVTLGLVVTAMATGLPAEDGQRLLASYWRLADRRALAPRLVSGNELMSALGLPPGPHLGRILERLAEAQALGEVATREEALACAASIAAQGE